MYVSMYDCVSQESEQEQEQIRVCIYACMHVCMYVFMYACMYAYIYIYICMYVCIESITLLCQQMAVSRPDQNCICILLCTYHVYADFHGEHTYIRT
jgi:hypothetical protein